MNKSKMPELDKLFSEIGTYRTSSELSQLYQFIKKFPNIAPYNAMLIHIQKPGSKYVASASEWLKRFNRTIRPGARPIVILRPFGPVAFVFDLSDTEGKETFPEELLNPFRAEGVISNSKYNRLINNMICDGVNYYEADHGTTRAGSISTYHPHNIISIKRGKTEYEVEVYYNMQINSNHPMETKFTTMLHELGHLYCGHLGTPNEKMWKERRGLSLNEVEFEAESVCWLICERMGLKNPSAQYLAGYLNNNDEIPNISIDTVLRAVGTIETLINGTRVPSKEIIRKKTTHQ